MYMGLANTVSGLAVSAEIQATNFWGNLFVVSVLKCFVTLNISVGVGRKHYPISAWLAVSGVLTTLKNSVWVCTQVCLSCLVKLKLRKINCTID